MEKVQKEANKMYDNVVSTSDAREGPDKSKKKEFLKEMEDRLIVALISSYRL